MRLELLVDVPEEDGLTYEEALGDCRQLLGLGDIEIYNAREIKKR